MGRLRHFGLPRNMSIFDVFTDTYINRFGIVERPAANRFPACVVPAQQHFRPNRL
jgi:hypothetical protein